MAAKAVTDSLNSLLLKLKETQSAGDIGRSTEAYQVVLATAESLLAATDDPKEVMKRARALADVRLE